jgi:hypothetical protein
MSKSAVKAVKPDLTAWMTKQQAAGFLSVAERTIDRLASNGQIQKAMRKRPGKPALCVFYPEDLQRIKDARDQAPLPFIMPQPAQQAISAPQTALVQALTAIAERVAATVPTPALVTEIKEPFFLSLKQAREVSGLPLSALREYFIKPGRALRTGAGWRIRRADLEQFGRDGHHGEILSKRQETA